MDQVGSSKVEMARTAEKRRPATSAQGDSLLQGPTVIIFQFSSLLTHEAQSAALH
jgi:hypothetical protein